MSLASNALIDLEYYRTVVQIDDSATFNSGAIESLINQASQMIETECNRKFITPSVAITEVFNGDGNRDHYVKNARIIATPTLKEWDGDSFETTSYTFTYDQDTGRVYFTDGNVFSRGKNNWQISYTYGWTLSTVPADLKLACVGLTSHLRLLSQKMGIVSESFGDSSTTYDWEKNPFIQRIINDYKVVNYG